MSNLNVQRTELKYLISHDEYMALVERLKCVVSQDSHSQKGKGYFIRSLYFDSHNDRCLIEKQGGIIFRKKYRMRIYNLDSEEVKFEIKHRANSQIFKETAKISRDTAKKVIKENYIDLLKYDNDILNRIYTKFVLGNYKPKIIIDYYRDAFKIDLCNIRITIDKYIKTNISNFDIFSSTSHTVPVIFQNKHVLEVKFDKILPEYIKKILQIKSFERVALSKYTLGRRIFKNYSWEDN